MPTLPRFHKCERLACLYRCTLGEAFSPSRSLFAPPFSLAFYRKAAPPPPQPSRLERPRRDARPRAEHSGHAGCVLSREECAARLCASPAGRSAHAAGRRAAIAAFRTTVAAVAAQKPRAPEREDPHPPLATARAATAPAVVTDAACGAAVAAAGTVAAKVAAGAVRVAVAASDAAAATAPTLDRRQGRRA